MLKIEYTEIIEGDKVAVQLNNNQSIWFSLSPKIDDLKFAALFENGKLKRRPMTDGCCVYWPDGPRLTIKEIMEIVKSN